MEGVGSSVDMLPPLFTIPQREPLRVLKVYTSHLANLSFHGTSTQESEVQLLQDAKRFTEQIQQQQFHLQQADNFPEAFTTEVSKMREQLLKYQNEYNAVKEREFHNQYRLNR